MNSGNQDLASTAARIEGLVKEAEHLPDERARTLVVNLLRELLHLYGCGWQRVLELAARHDGNMLSSMAQDELLSHLLFLHGLHPVAIEDRIARALDDVRPALHAHGGDVELLGLDGSTLRLRLNGSCHGCPSSAVTLKTTVEEALRRAAPELDEIRVEDTQPRQTLITVTRS